MLCTEHCEVSAFLTFSPQSQDIPKAKMAPSPSNFHHLPQKWCLHVFWGKQLFWDVSPTREALPWSAVPAALRMLGINTETLNMTSYLTGSQRNKQQTVMTFTWQMISVKCVLLSFLHVAVSASGHNSYSYLRVQSWCAAPASGVRRGTVLSQSQLEGSLEDILVLLPDCLNRRLQEAALVQKQKLGKESK